MLPHTLLVYQLEYLLDKFRIHAQKHTLRTAFVQNFIVTSRLQNRHIVLFLERTDFTCHTHTLGKFLHQVVVALVNLLAQFAEVFRGLGLFTDDEQVQDVIQYVRSHLLRSIAPCTVGVAVAFDNQTVETEVNGQKASYVGNICMDVCMIDVTDIDCKEGDKAIIFGDDLPVTVLSEILETIPYEILTSVSNRVKRVYYQN